MQDFFHDVAVLPLTAASVERDYLHRVSVERVNDDYVVEALANDRLTLVEHMSQAEAAALFSRLVERFDLRDSYNVQMQFVVHMLQDREPVGDVAVTVNERGPYQIIQPHSEGDSSSPLELLALYCRQNAVHGGENVFSQVNQDADHSRLQAKEKFLVGEDIAPSDEAVLRQLHRDIVGRLASKPIGARTLYETDTGSVVVAPQPVARGHSRLNDRECVTYWDNVTVHDRAFHLHHYELLKQLGILRKGHGSGYDDYMHVEADSDWAPADTCSGTLEETAKLFSCHIPYKMKAGDFLIVNNRTWTHAVNNWEPSEPRKLIAMYA